METSRTPDERFADLPDCPWPPAYAEVPRRADGAPLRMHYVDDGPPDGAVALLLHGEPSWSYLYRHVVAVADRRGRCACVVPDLVGFGRSDKPPRWPTTATPGTSSGCASWSSTPSTCATSRWSARTGAG